MFKYTILKYVQIYDISCSLILGHINHIRRIAGVDSVGIGASYDGISA